MTWQAAVNFRVLPLLCSSEKEVRIIPTIRAARMSIGCAGCCRVFSEAVEAGREGCSDIM